MQGATSAALICTWPSEVVSVELALDQAAYMNYYNNNLLIDFN
jgi:hypothetical protein